MSHTIYTGDCIEVMKTLDKVDVCIFDPPYSEHVHSNSISVNGKLGSSVDFGFASIGPEWMDQCSAELARIVKRWVLVFCCAESLSDWRTSLEKSGFEYIRAGAWVRAPAPQLSGDRPSAGYDSIAIVHKPGRKKWNGGGTSSVWSHRTCAAAGVGFNNTREHPTQKPLPLMVELVSLFSDPGETVLDCCAGSGTTGVAAVRLGRHFIGIEQQEKWATIARERCEAEDQGSDVVAHRAGQIPLFGGVK